MSKFANKSEKMTKLEKEKNLQIKEEILHMIFLWIK